MKAIGFAFVLAAGLTGSVKSCVPAAPPAESETLAPGRIVVTPNTAVHGISPYIYGVGVEWTEGGTGILDASGRMRPEVVSLLKPLRLPICRFPGGILADHYQWRDGVGPQSQRPVRKNPMDDSEHANTFGTDEFIAFCKATGADALITANFGTGSVEEAVEWQRYFASRGFRPKAWEVGNEIYLAEPVEKASIPGNDRRIYKDPKTYAEALERWYQTLHDGDPEASVGAIAGTRNTSRQNQGWLDVLLGTAPDDFDFLALHNSFAPLIFGPYDYKDANKRRDAYRAMFAQALMAAEDAREVKRKLAAARPGKPVDIAITEHFPLFGGGGSQEQLLAMLDQTRSLGSALFTASLFHAYMREGVWMANYNLVVHKWFGALLTDTDKGLVRTPTYHVYDLYRNHFGSSLVASTVESPRFAAKAVGAVSARGDVPYLDAVASRDASGHVYLAVVNRHLERSLEAAIEIAGLADGAQVDVRTLTGPAVNAINGPALGPSAVAGELDAIRPALSRWGYTQGSMYAFAPRSVTIFQWRAR